MAVPDWPTTYGYNMFLYPWSTWVAAPWNLFIEHGHRLLGSFAGILTIGLNVAIWKYDPRPWMRWVGLAALGLVISQGLLGGLRVTLSSTDFARIHGMTGPLFFALVVAICVMTSRFWWSVDRFPGVKQGGFSKRKLLLDAWLLFGLAYCQLALGAHLRHPNVDWSPSLFRVVVLFHVLVGLILLLHAGMTMRRTRTLSRSLRWPATLVMLLVGCQVTLGLATWRAKYGLPNVPPILETSADQPYEIYLHRTLVGQTIQNAGLWQVLTVTGHVAMGSLILASCVVYITRLSHPMVGSNSAQEQDGTSSQVSSSRTYVSAVGGPTS